MSNANIEKIVEIIRFLFKNIHTYFTFKLPASEKRFFHPMKRVIILRRTKIF